MKKLILFYLLCIVSCITYAKEPKTSYRNALVLAYSKVNSVFEDDNIKLEIYNEKLYATNKTSKTIFIDHAQCFQLHNGRAKQMFDDGEKNKINDDKKASVNGISFANSAYITIAPSSGVEANPTYIADLSLHLLREYGTTESSSEDFTVYDKRFYTVIGDLVQESLESDPNGKNYIGTACRHLTEDESISTIGASIAYAFNKQAEDWTNISITTWVSDVIFAPFYLEFPKELSKKEKRGFGVKETDPIKIHLKADTPFEFDQDKSPLIICEWEGNYKKGTFKLSSTRTNKIRVKDGWGSGYTFRDFDKTIKCVYQFDGKDANWGKLTYTKSLLQTSHSE